MQLALGGEDLTVEDTIEDGETAGAIVVEWVAVRAAVKPIAEATGVMILGWWLIEGTVKDEVC
jgi:hypothetical protein